MSMIKPGYEALAGVLHDAYEQASSGKGAERHAQGQSFEAQPMQQLISLYGHGFALGQAAKKAQEAQRLPYERARAELLGAINYLSGAVIAMDLQNSKVARIEAAFDLAPSNDNRAPCRCGGCPDSTCEGRQRG